MLQIHLSEDNVTTFRNICHEDYIISIKTISRFINMYDMVFIVWCCIMPYIVVLHCIVRWINSFVETIETRILQMSTSIMIQFVSVLLTRPFAFQLDPLFRAWIKWIFVAIFKCISSNQMFEISLNFPWKLLQIVQVMIIRNLPR